MNKKYVEQVQFLNAGSSGISSEYKFVANGQLQNKWLLGLFDHSDILGGFESLYFCEYGAHAKMLNPFLDFSYGVEKKKERRLTPKIVVYLSSSGTFL